MNKIFNFVLFYALIPFIASLPFLALDIFYTATMINIIGVPMIIILIYLLFRRKLNFSHGRYVNGYAILILSVVFTVMMILSKGNTEGVFMQNFCWLIFPFAPVMLLPLMMGEEMIVFLTALLSYLAGWIFCMQMTGSFKIRRVIIQALCVLICILICANLYVNRPYVKYNGHGFDYMNGYSSTDFTDYTVYAERSRLVELDHEPSFTIENEEEMPVLDGAEACYPLYAAIAKAVYKDIDRIEMEAHNTHDGYPNGRIVTFSNTISGFQRLVLGAGESDFYDDRVDIFFGARPSEDQLKMAEEYNVELEITPIGHEGFVFFVEEDNPVEGLSSSEIRGIYHGDISNWNEVGGKNQDIAAFQRPDNSGSQTMMTYFMGDTSLKEPATFEMVDGMGGVIRKVAQYSNEAGAIGYTFRYFLEELNQEKGVKMLKVDGVYPSVENIENGTYPLTGDLCIITRKDDPNPNVQKMIDFILSGDGQSIIRETGYAPLAQP